MDKYLNSKWTSTKSLKGWRHYEVRNVLKKKKQLELFAVCDNHISVIIELNDINNQNKWLPGWKDIL
tara:strand:- start:485 stop:685 length:201 start_codon:yes stop_codon:yes gene_type:complete